MDKKLQIPLWVWKTMKNSFLQLLLLALFCDLAHAHKTNGQGVLERNISIKAEGLGFVKVLSLIEKQAKVRFIYSPSAIDVNQKVTITERNKTLGNVLKAFLLPLSVEFTVVDDRILLKRIASQQLIRTNLSQDPQSLLLMDKNVDRKVTGKVTDEKGEALPGVSILVKGTQKGGVTDVNGNFNIVVPDDNATILVFSFVGYLPQEVLLGNKASLSISLVIDKKVLDEVVVVGYGTSRKQDITGAVATADIKAYEDIPVNNVFETIKGTVAGLNIDGINSAGEVGELSIRGQNTPTASNSPLIVVDGVIFNGSLADIQSHDVKSLTVLKDASAAAIYGARSGNGVILIETKSGIGINGKPKFTFNANYGISNQLTPLKLYDGAGYLQRVLDIREAYGSVADPSLIASYLEYEERQNYEATSSHTPTFNNPYDIMNQVGVNSKINLGVSQSTDNTDYYISLSLTDQKGIRVGDRYKNINARVNINSDLTKWFSLGIKSYYSQRDYSGAELSNNFQLLSPYASLYEEDGSYMLYPQSTTSLPNPYLRTANVDNNVQNTLNGIISGTIKFPIEGLTYRLNYSNTLNWTNTESFYDENTIQGMSKNGYGSRTSSSQYAYLLDQIVAYNRVFAKRHRVDLTLLYSREQKKSKSLTGYGENFTNTLLLDYGLETALIQTTTTDGSRTASTGKMARLGYTFNDKYAFTATARQDGFSAFSEGYKYATFYSLGGNWNITKESFLKKINYINNLSLRASYGKNGNQSVDAYSTLAKVSFGKYLLGGDSNYSTTIGLSSLALSVFGWETTTSLNLGLDFGFLNNRISGSLDIYQSNTSNLLFDRPLPAPSGTSTLKDNAGKIQNKGIELNLNTVNIEKGDFSWTSAIAFSLNRNKVVTITGDDANSDGVEDDLISSGYFIGKPLGTIYNYKVVGTWQEGDEIINGMRAGDYKVEDVNNDGQITSDADRQFLGNSNPNFRWSFTNTVKYKNWSLVAYLYSIWGGKNYYLSMTNTPYYDSGASKESLNGPVWDYWTPTNTDTPWPRVNYNTGPYYSAIKPFDRSFIKLQKIALSYDLTKLVKPLGVNGLKLSVSADNLGTYAPKWIGLDPETEQGLTNGSVPSMRTYIFSVMLNF